MIEEIVTERLREAAGEMGIELLPHMEEALHAIVMAEIDSAIDEAVQEVLNEFTEQNVTPELYADWKAYMEMQVGFIHREGDFDEVS